MEEYALCSAEADYKTPGKQAPIGFMALCGEIQGLGNASPWMDQKRLFPPSPTGTENTRWETADVGTIMA